MGYLSAYSPGVMERVAERRMRLWGLQPSYGFIPECLVALNADHVGEYVVLVYSETGWVEVCWVVDTCQPLDRPARERAGMVAEVNWPTFERLGNGPVMVLLLGR